MRNNFANCDNRNILRGSRMDETNEEVFYECLTPPQSPSPQATKRFYLPLSTLSIYCREKSSTKPSSKSSVLRQNGVFSNPNDSATIDKALSTIHLSYLSSVAPSSTSSHMTDYEAALAVAPTTLLSTALTSYGRLSHTYQNLGVGSYLDSSPATDAPPLSPSSPGSTIQSLSEPPTPTGNGSIDPSRFSTSPPSSPRPETSNPNKVDDLTSVTSNSQHSDTTPPPTPLTPTPKPARKSYYQNLASKKKTNTPSKKRRVPIFIPEPGPFIPEGLHLVKYPTASSTIVPDTLEAGHIIAYGLYPVQPTALQIAREKRRVTRKKVRYYGAGDEVKNVLSSGSVSGESESSEDMEQDAENEKERS
ncbi:hypothetical protein BKA65DRAFT_552293 [Rhexocercosporidium sp. MPI-PUGE-AT-0058]|nr:hypothetical protein BKA65DRAFT_552293 [Rhexocercosporidium sp. MPI-PUGE-AT-0058]